MEDKRKHYEKQAKIGKVLANYDGCESGDLLHTLIDWAQHAKDGHGYAMSDRTERFLREAIDAEIEEQLKWVDDPDGYHTPEEVKEVKDLLKKIEEKYG